MASRRQRRIARQQYTDNALGGGPGVTVAFVIILSGLTALAAFGTAGVIVAVVVAFALCRMNIHTGRTRAAYMDAHLRAGEMTRQRDDLTRQAKTLYDLAETRKKIIAELAARMDKLTDEPALTTDDLMRIGPSPGSRGTKAQWRDYALRLERAAFTARRSERSPESLRARRVREAAEATARVSPEEAAHAYHELYKDDQGHPAWVEISTPEQAAPVARWIGGSARPYEETTPPPAVPGHNITWMRAAPDYLRRAVADGKITAARIEHWVRLHRADPAGTVRIVAGMYPGVFPTTPDTTPAPAPPKPLHELWADYNNLVTGPGHHLDPEAWEAERRRLEDAIANHPDNPDRPQKESS